MRIRSWAFTRNVIAINHNRDVRKFFKMSIQDKSPGATEGRNALIDAMLINRNDSSAQVLNKQIHFRLVLEKRDGLDNILSQPESWLIQHGRDIPQLKIIYRTDQKGSGNYDINIPHFNGSKGVKPPDYTKGNTPVVFNLKDRSKIVINAESESAGKSVINSLLKFVDPKFIKSKDAFVFPSKTKVKKQRMKAVRGDFYPKGQEAPMLWRVYF